MRRVAVIQPVRGACSQEGDGLATWDRFAEYFRKRAGYVSTKLHRALGPDAASASSTSPNGESPEHFVAALQWHELLTIAASLPVNDIPRSLE